MRSQARRYSALTDIEVASLSVARARFGRWSRRVTAGERVWVLRGARNVSAYELICSDRSRRINNSEPDWETTSEGRPKFAYDLWHDHLGQPLGFPLKAEMLEHPGAGDISAPFSPGSKKHSGQFLRRS
jgi:hypothetical protein